MPRDIHQQYEELLRKAIKRAEKQIKAIYEQSIVQISLKASTIKLKDQPFSLSLYPLLDNQIRSQVSTMHKKIYDQIVKSVKQSWDLSNKKNDQIVDKRFASKNPATRVKQIIYDPNKQAFDSFINRKEKGLNLSERVWNLMDPFKKELEQGLGLSINKGQSALSMATDLKSYLNNPDKLFRRVRNEQGKLVLSRAARNYHPGRGVYRSSFKNSLRLARTENNIAYRTADHERWKTMPFVTGIEIKTSGSHPKFDICDTLKGQYPKEFKFTGWHPQCLCYQVPKMMSEKEYDKLEDAILAGEDFDSSHLQVKKPPEAFNQYVVQNKKRIEGWANKPYWVKDNQEFFDGAKPIKVDKVPGKGGLTPAGNSIKSQFTQIEAGIRDHVDEALSSIDSVHGDGILKDIPFEKVTEAFEAAFVVTFDQPSKIMLSTGAMAPAMSITHEMGHYLDHYTIGRKGSFATHQADHPIQKVIAAAEQTKAIQELRRMRKERYTLINNRLAWLTPQLERHIDYLLTPHEIWARLYAQYIATKSNSIAMKEGLKKHLAAIKKMKIPRQWGFKDFKLIEKAMDEFMIARGWISQ